MNKVEHIENFIKNIINYKDFIDIESFFDNIPESSILTWEDLQSIIKYNNNIVVIGPDFYTNHQILDNNNPNITGNMFYIYQCYAVTGNNSSYWYKINEDLLNYIIILNTEICNQMLCDQLV